MDLEPATRPFAPQPDRRPRVPEPLPVRLVTIDDARVVAAAGLERQLDAFYVGVLGFARDPDDERLAYRADNFTLHVDVREPPVRRDDVRPLGVEVPSLADLELKLIDAQVDYTRQRGLLPGEESIALMDPGGNWLTVVDRRAV
jgi:hypothetical protein